MEENVALDSSKQKQFVKSIKGIKKLIKVRVLVSFDVEFIGYVVAILNFVFFAIYRKMILKVLVKRSLRPRVKMAKSRKRNVHREVLYIWATFHMGFMRLGHYFMLRTIFKLYKKNQKCLGQAGILCLVKILFL